MTEPETFLNGRVTLHCGDCLDVLKGLQPDSVDACVTDPPYHLSEVPHVKRGGFGGERSAERKQARAGFMGKHWDGGDIAFTVELWREVFRVLKPGAHLLAFGGTRTYHRMACAIEDAGFEVRDCVQWIYGSGFPKSHDVSKGIDRAAGAEREVIGRYTSPEGTTGLNSRDDKYGFGLGNMEKRLITAPAIPQAAEWQGWGTALKPAFEPIVLARKPLSESTVAANVLRWGTGAINIDGCRIETDPNDQNHRVSTGGYDHAKNGLFGVGNTKRPENLNAVGRWPANVIHDGSDEVVGAFPDNLSSGNPNKINGGVGGIWSDGDGRPAGAVYGDSGSAARFFYTAKADSNDRLGSKHPTVKPVDLMQWLCRLITPPKGLVLDPFAGTGTTGEAAWREGFSAVLIEAEKEYQADIRRRMKLALAGPEERERETVKAKNLAYDPGPLFSEYDPHKDVEGSFNEAYRAVRERVAAGGPGWVPKPSDD